MLLSPIGKGLKKLSISTVVTLIELFNVASICVTGISCKFNRASPLSTKSLTVVAQLKNKLFLPNG